MKSVFLQTLILNCLTSQILKPALILAKTLTSDPYNGGLLKRRRSVVPEATHSPRFEALEGRGLAKFLQRSETETRELLGGMEENSVSLMRRH